MADTTTLPGAFHLNRGGLLHRFEQLSHLQQLRRRIIFVIAVGWVPLVLLGLIDALINGQLRPLLRDFSVHTRLLIAAPIYLLAEEVLNIAATRSVKRVVDERFAAADQERFAELVRRTERLRDARAPELIILALALLGGIATLVGWLHPTGIVGVEAESVISAPRIWLGVVGLPLTNFLLFRSLWRWAIWTRMLGGLARLRLELVPGHPDRRGGIGFLKHPSVVFQVVFLFGLAAVLCSSWATRVVFAGAHVWQFKVQFLELLVIGALLAFGPLVLFSPKLFLVARRGRREFGALATDYTQQFRERWIAEGPREGLLGSADIQSFNDLSGVFRESVERASIFLFGRRDLVMLVAALIVPAIPLILTEIPMDRIIKMLGELVLGAH